MVKFDESGLRNIHLLCLVRYNKPKHLVAALTHLHTSSAVQIGGPTLQTRTVKLDVYQLVLCLGPWPSR